MDVGTWAYLPAEEPSEGDSVGVADVDSSPSDGIDSNEQPSDTALPRPLLLLPELSPLTRDAAPSAIPRPLLLLPELSPLARDGAPAAPPPLSSPHPTPPPLPCAPLPPTLLLTAPMPPPSTPHPLLQAAALDVKGLCWRVAHWMAILPLLQLRTEPKARVSVTGPKVG